MKENYYCVRAGTSERLMGRDREPVQVRGAENAAYEAAEAEDRLGIAFEPISVKNWFLTFHAPMIAAKHAASNSVRPDFEDPELK